MTRGTEAPPREGAGQVVCGLLLYMLGRVLSRELHHQVSLEGELAVEDGV